jgi:two-component system, LytTR family, sensor kinase
MSQLIQHLKSAIFNNRQVAEQIFQQLSGGHADLSSGENRLVYHQCASFWANQHFNFSQALYHLDQGRQISERGGEYSATIDNWLDRSAVHTNERAWKLVQNALERARKLLKSHAHPRLQAHLVAREGVLHLRLSMLGEALEYLLEAERQLQQLGAVADLKDFHLQTLVLSSLGELYERRGDSEKSIDAYLRVLPIVEEHHLWPRLAWHYLNAGRIALGLSQYEEARRLFNQALETAHELEQEVKANSIINLGIAALINNDVEQAAIQLEAGASLLKAPVTKSDFDNLSKLTFWQAELSRSQGNYVAQGQLLVEAYSYGEHGRDLEHLQRVSITLADLFGHLHNYQRAWEWQKKAMNTGEKYYKYIRDTERQELDARYELERMRQEAQMAKLRVNGLQARALRAQMNPHFLFNSLNAIQGFITSGRDTEAATYLARFAKFMRQTLEYSDLEEVRLDEEIDFIGKYLEVNKKLRFRDQLHYTIIPPSGADAHELLIPAMIIQPFVENAIDHGLRPKQAGNLLIKFRLSEDENMLWCIIEDDGVGFNKGREKQANHSAEHQSHRSRGMEITRERLGLLHGDTLGKYVHIADISEIDPSRTGTRVEVQMPLLDG